MFPQTVPLFLLQQEINLVVLKVHTLFLGQHCKFQFSIFGISIWLLGSLLTCVLFRGQPEIGRDYPWKSRLPSLLVWNSLLTLGWPNLCLLVLQAKKAKDFLLHVYTSNLAQSRPTLKLKAIKTKQTKRSKIRRLIQCYSLLLCANGLPLQNLPDLGHSPVLLEEVVVLNFVQNLWLFSVLNRAITRSRTTLQFCFKHK